MGGKELGEKHKSVHFYEWIVMSELMMSKFMEIYDSRWCFTCIICSPFMVDIIERFYSSLEQLWKTDVILYLFLVFFFQLCCNWWIMFVYMFTLITITVLRARDWCSSLVQRCNCYASRHSDRCVNGLLIHASYPSNYILPFCVKEKQVYLFRRKKSTYKKILYDPLKHTSKKIFSVV